jgi:hypothetical protein
MKVNDPNTAGAATAQTGRAIDVQKLDRNGASRASGSDPSGDHVEFSSALSSLSRALSTDSAQRQNHLAAVAAAYRSGSYQPDSSAISRAMVGDALNSELF